MRNTDEHFFKGIDGKYYVTKISLSGIYETFLITDDVKKQLIRVNEEFKKIYNDTN